MTDTVRVRPVEQADLAAWTPLWDGYNSFYGRAGPTALSPAITAVTWRRFFDPGEPVFALVAESAGRLVGLRTTSVTAAPRASNSRYLQDLFTAPDVRGRGVGRALILGVYEAAQAAGIHEVYWQTHETNRAGRLLYDKVATHAGYIVYEREV